MVHFCLDCKHQFEGLCLKGGSGLFTARLLTDNEVCPDFNIERGWLFARFICGVRTCWRQRTGCCHVSGKEVVLCRRYHKVKEFYFWLTELR